MCRKATVPIHPHTSPHWQSGILTFPRISVATFLFAVCLFLTGMNDSFAQVTPSRDTTKIKQDSLNNLPYKPSRRPTFRLGDRYGDPFSNSTTESPLFLKDPTKVNLDVELDSGLNYTIYEKIGELNYRPITTMSFEEFKAYQEREILKGYWQGKSRSMDGESAVSSRGLVPKIYISPVLDRIFGGSYVELVPRGFVTLDFGASFQKISNPNIPIRQQKNGGFEFDQQINMSVVGKVGEKLAVSANFDNNNSFDFQNNMKVEYTGFKEDILKKLEIGNVSLPLNNTLIQGSQNLFGVKAQMQFGKLFVTSIASTQRGKVESINIPGGSNGQGREFEFIASNYDESRHFFLGHFFRDNYEKWLRNRPQIISGINITRVEVYLINRSNDTQTLRSVVGFGDLAEPVVIYNPNISSNGANLTNDNLANSLFNLVKDLDRTNDGIIQLLEGLPENLVNGTDFEKINGSRKLAPTEYTFHKQLGYITLSRKLQSDEALAVAYEYTYNGKNYKVGELSEDYANRADSEVIFLKLLRTRDYFPSDNAGRTLPMWDLMMKNVYNLNVSQLTRDGFQLRVIYRDDKTGIDNPQLQEGSFARNKQLIEIMGLDKLNPVNDPPGDGNFDFVEGITINSQTGLIAFPYLEPFNTALRVAFEGEPTEDYLIQKYVFDTLYRTTKAQAELFATKNKFYIVGTYNATGSSKEILIPGFGVSPGSVRVYAGGTPLLEQTDYVVDYTFGRVTILNDAILNSGKNITVDYEQSDPFAFQTRSLLGTRFDYQLNDEVSFGSTLLYYNERPLITRNAIGTEPARNLQYGLDFNMRKNSRLLTKLVDAIPGIQTKEVSSFNWNGEFAQLIPGTSNKVDGEGTGYIDDFENTATPYSLLNPASWKLASTPKTTDNRYEGVTGTDPLRIGFRRAKLAWYQIDNQFYRDGGQYKPPNISEADLQNHYVRAVGPQEIFPERYRTQGNFFEQILDIAYYPKERGPYNYNDQLQVENGNVVLPGDPSDNWAGITTAIRTEVDFVKANIEYIEFWMLDPFITYSENGKIMDGKFDDWNTTGGKLIFHLGNVSEDVMRDSKHAFENGLPPNGDLTLAVKNDWGYVTSQQYLTNAFDNSTSSRKNQDVGFDGLSNANDPENEKTVFSSFLTSARSNIIDDNLYISIENDPSADDFQYFLGDDLDDQDAQLLQRYKNINGMENNTPIVEANEEIARSGSPYPDNEDINVDNTISELEEYYEYDINLEPGGLTVGSEYIVDKITVKPDNNPDNVTWYLFRIPVQRFENKVGNISGFTSIRYVRMVLTDFDQPVVLRLANFRMVGARWRRYTDKLLEGGLVEEPEPGADNFSVSVVSIEENSAGNDKKSPYKVPPGFVRDPDNTSSVQRQLNEQSIQVCIDGLEDGDARAIYKNVAMDFFNYGRVKMFVHANSEDTDDDELTVFMRLGTDYDQNYYEVEIPLKITPIGNTSATDIWPEANEFNFDLDDLYALKTQRDRERFSLDEFYPNDGPKQVGRHGIRIIGRPDLSQVKVIMIGVRNPRSPDKQRHTVCIWANELRLTDFDRTAGWAVNTTLSAKLADFGTVTGSLRYTTFGFGGVSSKISERTREETTAYDITASINLDKIFLGNTGIKLPMLLSYENTTINPNYDPANPDLRLDAALKSFETESEREAYVKLIQDQTIRRSLNFTNVRKVKINQQAKSHLYDIENFSFNYSYSEATRNSFTIEESVMRLYKGGIAYTFTPTATGIEPFKKSNAFKSPYLKLIKDFNFSLMPASILVRADLDRSFIKNVYRNSLSSSDPIYQKYFTFNRQYNVKWNLSKGLSLDYSARANAIVDEPEGEGDAVNEEIKKNLKNFGRMKNFDQSITANYVVPLDKFPLTDWLGAEYRYQVNYNWRAGPVKDPNDSLSLDFKNTIQNSRDQTITGRLDMVKLYNKVQFLKDINSPKPPPKPTAKQVDTVRAPSPVVKGFMRLLMSLRSVNGTYTITDGTILPGFIPSPYLFGMDKGFEAPGWGFVLGSQDAEIRFKAAENGWLTKEKELTNPFTQTLTRAFSARANIDPSTDLKIQLDVKKDVTDAYQEIFRYAPDDIGADPITGFASLNPSRIGSYKVSTITIGTAFNSSNDDLSSEIFHQFEKNLITIRERFQTITGLEYDTAGQDVAIAAFIAAYTGKNANTINLSPFPKTPLPNWRLDYTGLIKIPALKDAFQAITISHGYTSSYSVLNYSNSLQYESSNQVGLDVPIEDYNDGIYGNVIDGKVVPIYVISQVLITEQFSPLIGINVRTKGRLTIRADYKTKRDLALNVSNAQVTEVSQKDVSFELGYTKNNMRLPIKSQGRTIVLKNDVTFRVNLTVSDNKTIQRKIEEQNTVTSGNLNYQFRPNINYIVNQKLSIQMYYERTINDPAVSNAFRRATTRFGAQIRFSLAQ